MKATELMALAGLADQMRTLADDMNRTAGGERAKPVTGAARILAAYRNGERPPVQGPFTYVEALGLVTLNEKLLNALKELDAAPRGDSADAIRARRFAHYHACLVIAEAEAD